VIRAALLSDMHGSLPRGPIMQTARHAAAQQHGVATGSR
jgi:hypothetical protein